MGIFVDEKSFNEIFKRKCGQQKDRPVADWSGGGFDAITKRYIPFWCVVQQMRILMHQLSRFIPIHRMSCVCEFHIPVAFHAY
jgi:hypothetical protein